MSNSKVLATVNGKEITQDVVMKFLNDLGPQTAMQFQSPEGIKKVVEELINQEMLYLDAKENNLEEDQDFKDQLEKFKEGLIKQYAVSKILSNVQVSEDEMKEYFEKNKENFKNEESITSSHILVDSEEKANEIIKEIKEGMTFEEAAKAHSTCPSKDQGGNLGESTRGKMVPEFEDAAFAMQIGNVSEPVKTQFGYHVIKLYDKKEASNSTYEEVQDQIRAQVLGQKQQQAYIEKTDTLKEKYEVKNNM
jgi:peptidyl-prolyl cis-trans isomerase C